MDSNSYFEPNKDQENHLDSAETEHTSMRNLLNNMAASNTINDQADTVYATDTEQDDYFDAFFEEPKPMSKEGLAEYENDYVYMKSLYPSVVRQIQEEVEEQCDLLEYAGSCMFDKYPDKVHLGTIVNTIYLKMQVLDKDNTELQAEELSSNPLTTMSYRRHYGFASPPPPPISDYNRYGRPLWLRNMIEVMLYNEMLYRRRRFNCFNCR